LLGSPIVPTPNCATTINFNESSNLPSVISRAHYYSTRYSADILFTGFPVNISVEGDDGFRLWVDETLVIDNYNIQNANTSLRSVTDTWDAGSHRVAVEYFERTGTVSLAVHILDTRDGSELPHTGAGSPGPTHGPAPTAPFTPGYASEIWAAAGQGDMSSRLNTPIGQATAMVADASGNFYVADAGRDVVFKILPSGQTTVVAGILDTPGFSGDSGPANDAKLNDPRGLAFDASGNLFISDSANHRIRRIAAASSFAGSAISTVAGGSAGYVNDTGQNAKFRFPGALSYWDSKLYVADTDNRRVRAINLSASYGLVSTFAGSGTTIGGADFTNKDQWGFNKISDLVVSDNWIHITDSGNNQVLEMNFTANSNIHIVADASGSSVDGSIGPDAMVNSPMAIVGSSLSNTYFIEGGNASVRVVRIGDETIWTVAQGLQNPVDIVQLGGSYYVLEANFSIRVLNASS
jgi:PA14 domain/NHL repeat